MLASIRDEINSRAGIVASLVKNWIATTVADERSWFGKLLRKKASSGSVFAAFLLYSHESG